jgi:hypothetical protein
MAALQWTDYPKPNLRFIRGVWTIEVSIPASMRHLFGSGSGTTRNRRKSARTTDKSIAQSKMHELTHQIYSEFDRKQEEHLTRHHAVSDDFAVDAIYGLASSFNYKDIPTLRASTEYNRLVALKTSCDVYADKAEGEGEWNARKHGGPKRRLWRKIHIGIDEQTLEIRAVEVTSSSIGDAPMLPDLLSQIPPDQVIGYVTADGAYDTRKCHDAIAARNASAIIPPRKNAKLWKPDSTGARARNEVVRS